MSEPVKAETLKLGDIVKTASGALGVVIRQSSHVNGAGIILLHDTPEPPKGSVMASIGCRYAVKGELITLKKDDLAFVLDADFYLDDQCICRTYNQDNVVETPEQDQEDFVSTISCPRCGDRKLEKAQYCKKCEVFFDVITSNN